jgi:hypothetical protein
MPPYPYRFILEGGDPMLNTAKRGILLLAATTLIAVASFALPTPGQPPMGAQPLTCPSLRCPNGQILTCTTTPCSRLSNCQLICGGNIETCSGQCIIE